MPTQTHVDPDALVRVAAKRRKPWVEVRKTDESQRGDSFTGFQV